VIDLSTRSSSDTRVCSSIIDAILIALPSTVESNWKSIAHTTFGGIGVDGRVAKVFTAEHDAFWVAARKAHGDAVGTRALVEVLLHRHLNRVDVLAGIGANQHNIPLAAVAPVAAVLVVTVAGIAVRAPLARAPENTMKFVVGVMLTSFGVFWSAEGAGADWPGADGALLAVVPAVTFALALVALLRRVNTRSAASPATAQRASL
jgi:hypothetical protein